MRGKLARAFPAMLERDYRVFWTGNLVSQVGTWMQVVAQSWLVLELTGSALKLGLVSAAQFLPVLVLSPLAGPLVDRLPKRTLLLFTQTAMAALALVLAVLAWTALVRYEIVVALAACLGVLNALDIPARQSWFIELVGRDKLLNAISLNSAAFNLSRMVGPAVAGLAIGFLGIAPCFLANALSFLAVIGSLLSIGGGKGAAVRASAPRPRALLREMAEGFRYIGGKPAILGALAVAGSLSLFVLNYSVTIPVYARDHLSGGSIGYGLLMSCLGAGSLVGALLLAARGGRDPKPGRIVLGALGASAGFASLALVGDYWLACVVLALTGFCTINCVTTANTLIQVSCDDAHRGRAMSAYSMVFTGITPLGGMWSGGMIEGAGLRACFALSGLGAALFALPLAIMRARRPRRRSGGGGSGSRARSRGA